MNKRLLTLIPVLLAAVWLSSPLSASTQSLAPQAVLGSGFTYQGYLKNAAGTPINSTCNLRFRLWDALSGGTQIGSDTTSVGVVVSQGYFSALVNSAGEFGPGAIDNANARWLDVEVQCGGDASFTALTPRQPVSRSLASHDHWGQTWSGSGTGLTINGGSVGLLGVGASYGLRGENASTNGIGVYGWGSATTGTNYGVYGQSNSTSGRAVYGIAFATTGTNYGVYGLTNSPSGTAVYGLADASTGNAEGVFGRSDGADGFGVYGQATGDGLSFGLYGDSSSTIGRGVRGIASSLTGVNVGVEGQTNSVSGYGVSGIALPLTGTTYGVYGKSNSNSGVGVMGYTLTMSGLTYGVYGMSDSTGGRGVFGFATATSGTTYGVMGQSASTGGRGVYGTATATTGTNYGVYGSSSSPSGFAGYFSGNAHVTGTLTKGGGGFKIDHPLDPANQYLYHSFVESPEMKNVYDGVTTLDGNGQALVQLPAWFEVLNQDFRYQLTCIGGFAPVYIAQGIQNNAFLIAGGVPGLSVSWQVTGVRHDPWAEANRQEVEQPKAPEELGKYLHPELYGFSAEQGLHYLPMDDQLAGTQPIAPIPALPLPIPAAPEPITQPN